MIGRPEVIKGTTTRRVEADGPAGMVPGVLYMPADRSDMLPLILLGHGGDGHKDQPQWQSIGRFLARRVPAAVLCIDGPAHGERAPKHDDIRENFRAIRAAIIDPATAASFIEDWRASAAEARTVEGVHPDALGYVGFSMGTMFGIPICAALGSVRAAVFGIGGIPRPGGVANFVRERWNDEEVTRIAEETERSDARGKLVLEEAAKLGATDILMLNMTKDQLFPMDGALELFAAFPGHKRIAAWEGGHTELPREAMEMSASFLNRVFAGAQDRLEQTSGTF